MKSRRKGIALFAAGMLLGGALAGPAAQAAEAVAAQRSAQTIYVDGQRVTLEAYSIGGSNYLKLRDVGKAVGFNVYYDAAANAVQIESGMPYTGESPVSSTVTLPTDGSKYIPQVGDRILCDDGYVYEITDHTA